MLNFRGLKRIKFIYHGDWSDPELIYKKRSLNYYEVEGVLYEEFTEILKETHTPEEAEEIASDDNAFNDWIAKNKTYCYDLIKECFIYNY